MLGRSRDIWNLGTRFSSGNPGSRTLRGEGAINIMLLQAGVKGDWEGHTLGVTVLRWHVCPSCPVVDGESNAD